MATGVVGIQPLLWYLYSYKYIYIETELVPAARIQISKNGVVHLTGSPPGTILLLRFSLPPPTTSFIVPSFLRRHK